MSELDIPKLIRDYDVMAACSEVVLARDLAGAQGMYTHELIDAARQRRVGLSFRTVPGQGIVAELEG